MRRPFLLLLVLACGSKGNLLGGCAHMGGVGRGSFHAASAASHLAVAATKTSAVPRFAAAAADLAQVAARLIPSVIDSASEAADGDWEAPLAQCRSDADCIGTLPGQIASGAAICLPPSDLDPELAPQATGVCHQACLTNRDCPSGRSCRPKGGGLNTCEP